MFAEVLWWVAGISTGLFALKLIFMLVGADNDIDMDVDIDADGSFDAHGVGGDIELLSVTTILTFLMMGSWVTLTALITFELSQTQSIGAGLVGGVITAYTVAWLLMQVMKLQADGTLRDFDPRGLRGKVYVKIPKSGDGEGQIRLEVKGRLRTFRAVSESEEIDSFKPVVVTSMTKDHVMLVKPSS